MEMAHLDYEMTKLNNLFDSLTEALGEKHQCLIDEIIFTLGEVNAIYSRLVNTHEERTEREQAFMQRNTDYLLSNIDGMEKAYCIHLDLKHRYDNQLVSQYLEKRLQEADKRHRDTNQNNVTVYLQCLIHRDLQLGDSSCLNYCANC